MTKLKWKVSKYFYFKGWKIPMGEEVPKNPLRKYSTLIERIMKLIVHINYLRSYFFISGFIYKIIGKWVRENLDENTTYLDIGCGNLTLRRQLPKNMVYNAFDISFSEYILELAIRLKSVNIAIASATNIPLASNQVSILTTTEVLEHIPSIDKALIEIHRVAKPNALFFVSIPNNYCNKYYVKGQQENHCNKWKFDEFVTYMESHRFKLIKKCKKGRWIPFPSFITGKSSYQLPISSVYEYYNTNFFYMFKVLK